MKHFMLPLLRESPPFSDLTNPNPNPSFNHHNQKININNKTPRKTKIPSKNKENSDPAKICSPLPPKPPLPSTNPLKRKLSNDVVPDVVGLGPCSSSSLSDSEVRVVVRMRPLNKDEEEGNMIVQKVSDNSISINGHTFTYDSVADIAATQMDIFQQVGVPLVENCLAGFNSSVFAYGQTGSGKTYTMWGPANASAEENLDSDQQGLTPRVFERLFARINEEQIKHADKELKYQCRCSFLEIYNEQITDLLDPSQKNLQIREDVKSGVYVENLTEEYVSNPGDVIRLLLKGLSHRRTGATSINAESSRSHSVFTCVVESHCQSLSDGLSSFKTSRINLVDLAGSERQKLTGAAGERLKEAGNINRSLSQLGNLINILAEVSQTGKQRHIPYRDSRLTFLLQESLGGNAKLAMICAISPSQSCKSETFSTLRFAQRAKAIKNKAVVNEVMQDDVNFLREVIRQLKEELHRMKVHGNNTDPNAAYTNSWNAQRSLNLLKFSLNKPMMMRHVDVDGDEEMEIDEEAIDKLCLEVGLQPTSTPVGNSQKQLLAKNRHIAKQDSEVSDVSMEDGISEMDQKNDNSIDDKQTPISKRNDMERTGGDVASEAIKDGSALLLSNSANAEATCSPPAETLESSSPNLDVVPCEISPTRPSPSPSVSPRLVTSSRKSLRTSLMLTASQKDLQNCEPDQHNTNASSVKSSQRSTEFALTKLSGNIRQSTTEELAASLHRGLEILDCQRQSSAFRKSTFRFSFKRADLKPLLAVEKVDVGIQTLLDGCELPEETTTHLCSNCKNKTLHEDPSEANETSSLQLVPVDRSHLAEKPKKQVPKALEKVLAGAIRREMALEDFCAKQTSEIAQLNRLVQQYKHERECNAIIGQLREDKIMRLESLMDGVLPSEDFMDAELASLHKEHELLKEKYDNHPEVLMTKIELKRAQNELERYRTFFDMGERDVLLEEVHDLKSQLRYYTDDSQKSRQRKSLLQLTYPCESISTPPLNTIPESTEENALEKLEHERSHWNEVESQWISLAEELKIDLEESRFRSEQLKQELEAERKCSEELKEAMQLAMQGHARMLENYAELEERHMVMLARQRKIQEGIGDVKKAAAKAGVKGAESKFINALAAQISGLKVEREKERQYLRDENKMLQSQLRDTAEAVQAAGELLVRLKEAEEAVVTAKKRAAKAEEETANCGKQMELLKKKHEMEIGSLNQIVAAKEAIPDSYPRYDAEERNSAGDDRWKQEFKADVPRYDAEERNSAGDDRWKQEFKAFYDVDNDLSSKFGEASIWFSGYDKCNI